VNERIARWLGLRLMDEDDPAYTNDFGGIIVGCTDPDADELPILFDWRKWGDGDRPVAWAGYTKRWEPDTDITLWHGKGGLLEEIERQGPLFIHTFGRKLQAQTVADEGWLWWHVLRATPEQLSAALDAVLKEADDGS